MRTEPCEPAAGADALRARLRHVYWIGGGSAAGKSTIAGRVAARHGFRVYSTDEVMSGHARRSTADDAPFLGTFKAMDMDERWVNRSPQVMLETFHWFRGEGFGLIVDDLLSYPARQGVIAEGFRLLPHLVKPLATRGHAVWLLPAPGSAVPRWTAAARYGRSRGGRATRKRPSATCWSATGCSPFAWARK